MAKAKTKRKPDKLKGKWTGSSLVTLLHEQISENIEVTKKGVARLKRAAVRDVVDNIFEEISLRAAKGQRVRLPVVGALVRKNVPARKAGKGTNPFTGEPMKIKARAASKKPRWSFPKSLRATVGKKKNWR